jgi:DNA polymerase-3 subunit gamma/tau
VIEIDGASNNGVEQVRELRQNAGLRPARSRFKIYYIDEVHMLTTGAFNALLKTLEEPPGHVKFLFATTEPGKIPITVLSRCQRYDLAGISPESIARTLESVCRAEGIDAEPEAVAIVARRASGSMRDALSLLEPLLAMGLKSITGDDVRRSLGLASDERLIGILEGIADHEAGRVLTELDAALSGGVQPGEVLAGVSELARDVMVGGAGGAATLMGVSPAHRGRIQAISTRWSLDSVLAALEIFSQARLRLRGSAQPRLVVELTLVRAARLENMVDIGSLLQQIERLAGDAPSGPTSGSKSGARDGGYRRPDTAIAVAPESANGGRVKPVVRSAPTSVVATGPTSGARSDLADGRAEIAGIRRAWGEVLERLDAEMRGRFSKVEVDEFEPPALVFLGTSYNWLIDTLDRPELLMKIETLFEQVIGQRPSVRFRRRESVASPRRIERHEEICADPLVAKVIELFEARPVQIEAADALDDVAGSGETSEC